MKGEPAGLVDGIPVSIKDTILTKGWPTLRGSHAVDPLGPWDIDGPCTERLREQGAVILGKTTTPEFGWKGVTDNPLGDVARNPWDLSKTAGGSSGGAAVAAALGMGVLHIGTDGGGSIRIPAGFTGVFGLKPTYGRVPAYPASSMGDLAHIGPITRCVRDAALMLSIIARPDKRDWQALPCTQHDYRISLDQGVVGSKIAWSADLGYVQVDSEILDITGKAAKNFIELGAILEEINPRFEDPVEIFNKLWYSGAAAAVSRLPKDRTDLIDPGLAEICEIGARISRMEYIKAKHDRAAFAGELYALFEEYDLLLTPSLPIPAFEANREVPENRDMTRWTEWTGFTYPFNLTQQPAATVPCGFTKAGLPVGLQIVGKRYDDMLVLQAAKAIESLIPSVFPPQI